MHKKSLVQIALVLGLASSVSAPCVYAETFLTVEQARKALWNTAAMKPVPVVLSKEQMKSIKKASKTRVRDEVVKAWKTSDGGWFIIDQVVGKHEMIDVAVALNKDGSVKGVEILTYRETYGGQVRNPKWLAQFIGHTQDKGVLLLDEQIKNISGATLSSRHITDGVNRWVHTWDQVLRHL